MKKLSPHSSDNGAFQSTVNLSLPGSADAIKWILSEPFWQEQQKGMHSGVYSNSIQKLPNV